MNKLHSFASIALAAIGIFFAARLIDYMLMFGNTMIIVGLGFATVIPLMFLGLCFAAIWYVCLYKREQLAEKIVGTDELADPHSQVDWLYVAFRLVCIAAGVYCLHSVAWRIAYALRRYLAYSSQAASSFLTTELILGWLVMLAIGIYLVCGAPHFVRWHVKKTLEQCRLQEEEHKLE